MITSSYKRVSPNLDASPDFLEKILILFYSSYLAFPIPVLLVVCEGRRIADIPCSMLHSATQTGCDSLSYKLKK